MSLYLDYNATAPVDPRVLDEMIRVYREEFGNAGSRTHGFGQRASALAEQARSQVAALHGVDKNEVIFTSGATESDNLAILGLAEWGLEHGRRHIISTTIEHKAVLEPLQQLSKRGFEVELVPVGESGRVDPDEIRKRLRPETLLVSMMHANNETGIIQPVTEIGDMLARTETYFHVDAAQTSGKLVGELKALKYDLLSVSAHKLYGPQGVGALILRKRGFKRPPVRPLMYGGSQEGGLRPGTLPVALVVGLGTASFLAGQHWKERHDHSTAVQRAILQQLHGLDFRLNGDPAFRMVNCMNLSFEGVDSEGLMLRLQDTIAVSNGSACTSAEYKPSHVLIAMGLARTRAESAVRISWGPDTPLDLDLSSLVYVVQLSL